MKLRKIIAVMALAAMSVVPMTAFAAKTAKVDNLNPVKTVTVTDKQKGLDLTFFQVKDLKNVAARHAINRAIIDAASDLVMEHKTELEKGECDMKITSQIRYNGYDVLSATFTSEGMVKGAAHGFKSMKSINYNYATGEEITAEDLNKLFKAAKMEPAYTVANINKLLKAEEKAGKITLLNGVKTLPPFYLSGKSLDITAFFQPYEVAPYANGIVTLDVH